MSKVTDRIMKRRLVENPFGTWNTIPELREDAPLNEKREFNLLWNETSTEDLSEDEVSEYLEKLGNNQSILNEAGYAEQGWWGVSPFAWTQGFRVNSIFKPLKWLALPLIGGVVMLLAGIWKLLKEGKKQIAIARVRAWINRLVVIADSGLKKTRNTKDSLFLIRQRYRRDILQNAVKVATALGIDIEEKDTKPESVETSLNEAMSQTISPTENIQVSSIINDNGNGEKDIIFFYKGTFVKCLISLDNDHYKRFFVWNDSTGSYEVTSGNENEIVVSQYIASNYDKMDKFKDIQDGDSLTPDGRVVDKDGNEKNREASGESNENIDRNTKPDSSHQGGNPEPAPRQTAPDISDQEFDDNDGSDNGDRNVQHKVPSSIPAQPQLPDDSRVDWSLMNSVRASQWFGLKHKTTNFWKEAKSVAVIQAPDGNNDPLRFCGLLVSQVSMSLTLIANSGVAQSYASIMNKYIEILTKIRTADNLGRSGGNPIGTNRFKSNMNDSKYSMFAEDFAVFESSVTESDMEEIRIFQEEFPDIVNKDKGFSTYLINLKHLDLLMTFKNVSVDKQKAYMRILKQDYNNYLMSRGRSIGQDNTEDDIENVGDMIDQIQPENRGNGNGGNGNENQPKMSVDNIDKYLIAALSKILANVNYNDWQVNSDAYNQMLKFINELTKVVNTVIDSVAKKAEDKLGAGQQGIEGAVLRFIGSDADPKQNRSLKNLWNNLGVSKLQQRTIVHCQEIVASPEMQYYLDMFMVTVPSIIKNKLVLDQSHQIGQEPQDSSTGEGQI